MEDIILLEETIVELLRGKPTGLAADTLENFAVARLGRRGDPVEMAAYETALNNLIAAKRITEIEVITEGYGWDDVKVPGYKID